MSDWKMKRFWTETTVAQTDAGWRVLLDGRSVKTPGKSDLVVPNRAMAEVMRDEWDAQDGEINPETMPVTKAANSAIDKVMVQFSEVADMLADYAGTDLLCYRAATPIDLKDRQSAQWDPLLDWCAERYGARLVPVEGLMFSPQDDGALERLKTEIHAMSPWLLTGVHELITIPGSLVLGLAILEGRLTADAAWDLSRLDELYQQEDWGVDEDAEALAAHKLKALMTGLRFCELLRGAN